METFSVKRDSRGRFVKTVPFGWYSASDPDVAEYARSLLEEEPKRTRALPLKTLILSCVFVCVVLIGNVGQWVTAAPAQCPVSVERSAP